MEAKRWSPKHSRAVTLSEFGQEAKGWRDRFGSASPRVRPAHLDQWKTALARLEYLELRRVSVGENEEEMARIDASFSLSRRNRDLAMIDMMRLWDEVMADHDRSIHALTITDDGFILRYAMVDHDHYTLSGKINVTCSR